MNKENFSVINYTDSEIPVFEEKQGQLYVSYGHDDLYGEYLRDLFLASSTNGAIINGVADMIYGGGLDATDRDDNDGHGRDNRDGDDDTHDEGGDADEKMVAVMLGMKIGR